MKFIIDAQLPRRMAEWFANNGLDAVHTITLPASNATTDSRIVEIAEQDGRIVVSKDNDFIDRHLLTSNPAKLLLISPGNISNCRLQAIIESHLATIIQEFQTHNFLDLGHNGLIIRG